MSRFSDRLRELRKEKGIKQSELAKYCGITIDTIKSLETGRRYPNDDALRKLSTYFDVSTVFLIGDCTDRKAEDPDWDYFLAHSEKCLKDALCSACMDLAHFRDDNSAQYTLWERYIRSSAAMYRKMAEEQEERKKEMASVMRSVKPDSDKEDSDEEGSNAGK